jgi:hypothetical protein
MECKAIVALLYLPAPIASKHLDNRNLMESRHYQGFLLVTK